MAPPPWRSEPPCFRIAVNHSSTTQNGPVSQVKLVTLVLIGVVLGLWALYMLAFYIGYRF